MLEFNVFYNEKLVKRTVITKGEISVGRSNENDLVLQDKHVSRLHFVIQREGEQFRITDRSANGMLIDGEKLDYSLLLPPQCRIEVFPFVINCICHDDDKTVPVSMDEILSSEYETSWIDDLPPSSKSMTFHFGCLIGESPQMEAIYRLIEDVASSRAMVLIRGEHGTGKELVARAIHEASQRREKPLIPVNCAAIPLDLIESELFGYEKGAFTGASSSHKGKVEEAKGGTLFLDEIGELSPPAQAKLLRFLQDRSFMRLGSGQEIQADVRIVAATNKDLEAAVQGGSFRADLYYRIKVVQIWLPSLRERPDDISLLASHFLQKFSSELMLSPKPAFSPEALERLCSLEWPGNIRQLENAIYSALVRSHPPYLLSEEIFLVDLPSCAESIETTEPPLEAVSKKMLLKVLKENRGDTAKTADVLKVSRGTIYYRLKKYGIDPREVVK